MWRLKLLTQFVLARLPWAEQVNYAIGARLRPDTHASATLRRRLPAYLETLAQVRRFVDLRGARVFEVGTGWCPIAPVLMHLAGAKSIRTVDHVPHLRLALARNVVEACGMAVDEISAALGVEGATIRERLRVLGEAADLPALLAAAGIDYGAPSDARRTGLADGSIDVWYTYSVLENVPGGVLAEIIAEARRIIAPAGVWFSLIGCQDPFASRTWGGRINYLQYSDKAWNFWTSNSLAHNNRLRERDFVRLLESAGFKVESAKGARHPEDLERLKTMKVDARFGGYTTDELAVHRSEITARPRQ